MTTSCNRVVSWWDGEYEGECELPENHDGPHFDGMSWFDDENEEVPAPEDTETSLERDW